MSKKSNLWIAGLVAILVLIFAPFIINWDNNRVFLGLPDWLIFFAVLQLGVVGLLSYLCFVLLKEEE